MKFNRKTIFIELKKKLFTDKFSGPHGAKQVEGINLLLDEGEKRGLAIDTLAYIMATVYRETAWTMQPIKEMGSDKYLKGKKYWPYIGRGFAQLTWKKNYEKASKKYGIDAVNDPDIVMEEPYAVQILFDGMLEGWFSGKKLGDYIDDKDEGYSEDEREFEAARYTVNGTDKKKVYADLAWEWRRVLNAAWVTNENPLHKSGTLPAAGAGVAGGAAVLVDQAQTISDAVDAHKDAFNSGNLLLIGAAILVIGATLFIAWSRWDAAGRPRFW